MSEPLNILVEAKREYMGQMCIIMTPGMIEVFNDLYNESVKLSKGRKTLLMFQQLLKEVPNWSNAMSQKHCDNITNRCSWYNDLLVAVFVACTKILSAVRLRNDNKKISLKVPSNEVFIQTCYNNVARDIYKDPYIFHEEQNEYVRDDRLTERINMCIENTVKQLIPVQQILQTYMSQESRDISLDDTVEDSVDPDVMDNYEPEPAPEPVPEPVPEVQDPMELPEERDPTELPMEDPEPVAEEPQLTGLENEFKTIASVKNPTPPDPEPEDDELFSDAPEERRRV